MNFERKFLQMIKKYPREFRSWHSTGLLILRCIGIANNTDHKEMYKEALKRTNLVGSPLGPLVIPWMGGERTINGLILGDLPAFFKGLKVSY